MKNFLLLACFLAITCIFPIIVLANTPDTVATIFYNGKILVADEQFRVVTAMAVADGKILAIGSDDEMQALCQDSTQKINLQGKTVMPGIIDSHTHPVSAAMYEWDHEVPTMETIADVLSYFKTRTAIVPKDNWITLQQVFITRLREKRYPTRKELDTAVPEHPAFMRTGPDTMLNSVALAKLGITQTSGDHPDSGYGVIERDTDGEPTGMLRNCTALGTFLVPKTTATAVQQQDRVHQQFATYLATGITTVADRNATATDIQLYTQLRDSGRLPCRLFVYHALDSKKEAAEIAADIEKIATSPLTTPNNTLWLCGVKMFLDGGMLTGSARMRTPWGPSDIYKITDPQYRGLLFVSDEKLTTFAATAMKHGLQPAVHCVGDGALETLLASYKSAKSTVQSSKTDTNVDVLPNRPSICHGNFMYPEAIAEIRRLDAVVDMQPAWLFLDGGTLRDHFGEKRMRYFQPYKTLMESGVAIGGGSDHMLKIERNRSINNYNPFLGMWTMITRHPRWTDEPLFPEERITREQAVRFYTADSAYVLRREKEIGTLEPGKVADFIILDRDILTCPLENLPETRVLKTWIDGRCFIW